MDYYKVYVCLEDLIGVVRPKPPLYNKELPVKKVNAVFNNKVYSINSKKEFKNSKLYKKISEELRNKILMLLDQ